MSQSASIAGKVALVTGGSSGIGLATVEELLKSGVKVISGDLQPPAESAGASIVEAQKAGNLVNVTTDVTKWSQLSDLFDAAYKHFDGLDFVFSNAGSAQIGLPLLVNEVDDDGKLKEPDHRTLDVNLISYMNTAKLAVWHWQKQDRPGAIVLTASISGYNRWRGIHYGVSKHAIIGLLRTLHTELLGTSIRVNAVAPAWTETKLFSNDIARTIGLKLDPPSTVAKPVVELFANESYNGSVLFTQDGKFEDVEGKLLDAAVAATPSNTGMTRSEESTAFLNEFMARWMREQSKT